MFSFDLFSHIIFQKDPCFCCGEWGYALCCNRQCTSHVFQRMSSLTEPWTSIISFELKFATTIVETPERRGVTRTSCWKERLAATFDTCSLIWWKAPGLSKVMRHRVKGTSRGFTNESRIRPKRPACKTQKRYIYISFPLESMLTLKLKSWIWNSKKSYNW